MQPGRGIHEGEALSLSTALPRTIVVNVEHLNVFRLPQCQANVHVCHGQILWTGSTLL